MEFSSGEMELLSGDFQSLVDLMDELQSENDFINDTTCFDNISPSNSCSSSSSSSSSSSHSEGETISTGFGSLTEVCLRDEDLPMDDVKSYTDFDNLVIKQAVNWDWSSTNALKDGASWTQVTSSFDNHHRKLEFHLRNMQTCTSLGISLYPEQWNCEEVKRWCRWLVHEKLNESSSSLPETIVVDGSTLCRMTHEDFMKLSPEFGENLFLELACWKGAADVLSAMYGQPFGPVSHQIPIYEPSYMSFDFGASTSQVQNEAVRMTSAHVTHERPSNLPLSSYFVPANDTSALNSLFLSTPQSSSQSSYVTSSAYVTSSVFGYDSLSPSNNVISYDSFSASSSAVNSPSSTASYDSEFADNNPGCQTFSLSHTKQGNHLWQFLKELLLQPYTYEACIRWLDRNKGIFKIEDSVRVAKLWGQRKNRPAMNYDKLSRSIRQYYKKGIIKKTSQSKRLVYQFCPKYV